MSMNPNLILCSMAFSSFISFVGEGKGVAFWETALLPYVCTHHHPLLPKGTWPPRSPCLEEVTTLPYPALPGQFPPTAQGSVTNARKPSTADPPACLNMLYLKVQGTHHTLYCNCLRLCSSTWLRAEVILLSLISWVLMVSLELRFPSP